MLRLVPTDLSRRSENAPRLNFVEIGRCALSRAETLLPRWLPGGQILRPRVSRHQSPARGPLRRLLLNQRSHRALGGFCYGR